jgi:hypothetical protein
MTPCHRDHRILNFYWFGTELVFCCGFNQAARSGAHFLFPLNLADFNPIQPYSTLFNPQYFWAARVNAAGIGISLAEKTRYAILWQGAEMNEWVST